jgi:hypothetical protein
VTPGTPGCPWGTLGDVGGRWGTLGDVGGRRRTSTDVDGRSTDVDRTSTGRRPDVDRTSTGRRPDVDRTSTDVDGRRRMSEDVGRTTSSGGVSPHPSREPVEDPPYGGSHPTPRRPARHSRF